MAAIDTTTDFGKRLRERLQTEKHIWLTTVRKDGTPQPSLVWFHWDGENVCWIFSQPNTPKVRNIASNAAVSLNLNSSDNGGDVAVLTGGAEILPDGPKAHEIDAYVTKYEAGFRGLDMTPEEMAASYSETIRVTIQGVRGW